MTGIIYRTKIRLKLWLFKTVYSIALRGQGEVVAVISWRRAKIVGADRKVRAVGVGFLGVK